MKNKNSFQHVLTALEYEQKRQATILDDGGVVEQNTVLFDIYSGKTSPMRSKEEAHDYRYFPEPDLVPFDVVPEEITQIKSTLPETPFNRRNRFVQDYNISPYDAAFLTTTRQLADFFEEAVHLSGDPKLCCNWIMGDISRLFEQCRN